MRINGMRDWLETEEVGLGRGRIDDASREWPISLHFQGELTIGPDYGGASVPA
jgi:hypothetical protein